MSVLSWTALAILLLLPPSHAVGAEWAASLPRVRSSLESPDVRVRLAGVAALEHTMTHERAPLIAQAMRDESSRVRLAAAEVAIKFHDPLGEMVVPWLSSAELEMRYAAVRLLEVVPYERALPELQRMMGDSDTRVRVATVRALATSQEPSSTAALVQGMSDISLSVRTEALRALALRGGKESELALLSALASSEPELRAGAEIALYARGAIDSEALRQRLQTERSQSARVAVVHALGAMNRRVDVDLLTRLIEPEQPLGVLGLATAAIVRQPSNEDMTKELLKRFEQLGDARARDSVAQALALHAETALSLVDECRKSTPLRELKECLWFCKYSGCRVEDVQHASQFERAHVASEVFTCGRWRRVEELAWVIAQVRRHDDKEWSPWARLLRRLLEYKSSPVLQAELESLLRSKAPGTSDYREGLSLLGLTGGRASQSRLLTVALAEQASELDVIAALSALRDANLDVIPDELFSLLNHPSLSVARATADLLVSSSGAASVLPWFFATDRDGRRRALRFISLGAEVGHSTGDAIFTEVATRVANESGPELDPLVEGVARNSLVNAQVLATRMSQSPKPWVRLRVASAIASSPASANILTYLLEDPEPPIRAEAAYSLGRIGAQSKRSKLARHLDDETANVAFNAMVALGKLAEPSDVPLVKQTCEWLVEPRPWRQAAALSALLAAKKRCDSEAEAHLLLASSSREIRRLAAILVQRYRSDADAATLGLCAHFDQDLEIRRICEGKSGVIAPSGGAHRKWVQIASPWGAASGAMAGTSVAVRTMAGSLRMAVTDRLGGLSCGAAEECPQRVWPVPDANRDGVF